MKTVFIYFALIVYCILFITPLWANQDKHDQSLSKEDAYRIVKELYLEKLGREADPTGLEFHVKLLLEEGKTREWLADGLANSPEGEIGLPVGSLTLKYYPG